MSVSHQTERESEKLIFGLALFVAMCSNAIRLSKYCLNLIFFAKLFFISSNWIISVRLLKMMRCFHLIMNWKSGSRTNGFCIPAAHNAWQSVPGLLLI